MERPVRKSPRLAGYDYASENYYFITICTHENRCLFWDQGQLNRYGAIAKRGLEEIPRHYSGITVERFVVMPNHVHMILILGCQEQAMPELTDVPRIINAYKGITSREIRAIQPGIQVWKRSFYDEIIRNDHMYREICRYIEENPLKWELDRFYR